MKVIDFFLISLSKFLAFTIHLFHLGSGETWPGHFASEISPGLLSRLESQLPRGSILITGTNGKTTTALVLRSILTAAGFSVSSNHSGANLLNGITSRLILDTDFHGRLKTQIGVFEVDEANLPLALKSYRPEIVVLLNLSRDQLDRYGEVDLTLFRWQTAFLDRNPPTILIYNEDDSTLSAWLENIRHRLSAFGVKIIPFGCSLPTDYGAPSLIGDFNSLNVHAAVTAALALPVTPETIRQALIGIKPAFGRGEILSFNGHPVQIFLAKNPASFNGNLALIKSLETLGNKRTLLMALNDNIPDGRDISWIYDILFEQHLDWLSEARLIVSGRRANDLALRLKYVGVLSANLMIVPEIKAALNLSIKELRPKETLFVLPTYSAMLAVREVTTGQAIGD